MTVTLSSPYLSEPPADLGGYEVITVDKDISCTHVVLPARPLVRQKCQISPVHEIGGMSIEGLSAEFLDSRYSLDPREDMQAVFIS